MPHLKFKRKTLFCSRAWQLLNFVLAKIQLIFQVCGVCDWRINEMRDSKSRMNYTSIFRHFWIRICDINKSAKNLLYSQVFPVLVLGQLVLFFQSSSSFFLLSACPHFYTVSGQNLTGRVIPLTLTKHTAFENNIVCKNQLLKLQPSVTKKYWLLESLAVTL